MTDPEHLYPPPSSTPTSATVTDLSQGVWEAVEDRLTEGGRMGTTAAAERDPWSVLSHSTLEGLSPEVKTQGRVTAEPTAA